MKYQIFSDKNGPWAVLFDRSPFCYGDLSQAEQEEIEQVLAQNDLVRDEEIPDAVSHRCVRVRVQGASLFRRVPALEGQLAYLLDVVLAAVR